jgi:hypothetical protein
MQRRFQMPEHDAGAVSRGDKRCPSDAENQRAAWTDVPRHASPFVQSLTEVRMPEINHHPLMFTFRDVISGDAFLAGITLCGRALILEEDGKWWMYGVRPAAIAESGYTPQEAFLRFRNTYKEVLFDIADEHRTFEALKQEVERFFYEPDPEEERRWEDAVIAIRSGNIIPPLPFSDLPREAPENRPTQITVGRLDGEHKRFMPSDNAPDMYFLPPEAPSRFPVAASA